MANHAPEDMSLTYDLEEAIENLAYAATVLNNQIETPVKKNADLTSQFKQTSDVIKNSPMVMESFYTSSRKEHHQEDKQRQQAQQEQDQGDLIQMGIAECMGTYMYLDTTVKHAPSQRKDTKGMQQELTPWEEVKHSKSGNQQTNDGANQQ
eukprot:5024707-Ditylum_brightwellii.AAC.1